jgi:phenylalanyl-tRNA synthetase alpha chain
MIEINKDQLIEKIKLVNTSEELEAVKQEIFGKSGAVANEMKKMATIPNDQKKEFGQVMNEIRTALQESFDQKRNDIETALLNEKLKSEKLDLSLTSPDVKKSGKLHPLNKVIEEINEIFSSLGFSFAEGPHVDFDKYNFEALNIPPHHPARQEQDTFYLSNGHLLRTQTSNVQIREMLKHGAPIKIFAPGRVFRVDNDATHVPMFHQVEGLWIDEKGKVTMQDLLSVLKTILKEFFEIDDPQIRVRQHDFPFTEPSVEVDVFYNGDWMELLGCGMTHPKVLENAGVDSSKYSGFAFGTGIDRIAMVKYGIKDLRKFFETDAKWLEYYGFDPEDNSNNQNGLS